MLNVPAAILAPADQSNNLSDGQSEAPPSASCWSPDRCARGDTDSIASTPAEPKTIIATSNLRELLRMHLNPFGFKVYAFHTRMSRTKSENGQPGRDMRKALRSGFVDSLLAQIEFAPESSIFFIADRITTC
jgi:hypothetical protein